ncbi:hypothetical protein [Synechococcus sp. BA-132 BA5]|uniref:hypothetical protein n=1 Tax=Synechococcus sp. BA-132 BA5 TaxID=3110252 RepID=UPI002B21303F|nr:hypothetical protein [Synechococcus sp. BA-132 BA5]MEA5417338.1 hypothetical protein [Synechococcus sp. BA-132 BA5]
MARSSVALFLVTTGLITATLGCGQAPESKEVEGGENGISTPAHDKSSPRAEDGNDRDEEEEGKDGEGGERGED